jgi:hypothetical protein
MKVTRFYIEKSSRYNVLKNDELVV